MKKLVKRRTSPKFSFALPAEERDRIVRLKKITGAKSNTEVIRRSLKLLEDSISREELRRRFREASARVRASSGEGMKEFDAILDEGLKG